MNESEGDEEDPPPFPKSRHIGGFFVDLAAWPRGTNGLNKTLAAWTKAGFRLSDKKSWSKPINKVELPTIAGTNRDRLDFMKILKPALKSKSELIVENVATGIVHLALIKEQRNEGWGYEYLRRWLMDQFLSNAASERSKQSLLRLVRHCIS